MNNITWIVSGLGIIITFSIFLAHVIFKTGHISARVEALESWRNSIRTDMHEISDRMGEVISELHALRTLVEERTERRAFTRYPPNTGSN